MVCACWMYANTDMGIICNPCDRYFSENVQAGSKKPFFLVKQFLQAYCLEVHKLRLLQRMEGLGGGT